MLASTSGRSRFGLRIEPRSPPVQVTTWTSTPSATYRAVAAAPLLDSSSGCACTCISRSPAPGRAPPAGCWDMATRVGGSIDGVDHTLIERYAAPPAWRRWVTIAVVLVVALVALGWLAWAAFERSNPAVESQLIGFDVVDEHALIARVDVRLSSGATGATCTVQAIATDHSIVGELHFAPSSGTNEVTVRTERKATAAQVPGCTADGQDRPR